MRFFSQFSSALPHYIVSTAINICPCLPTEAMLPTSVLAEDVLLRYRNVFNGYHEFRNAGIHYMCYHHPEPLGESYVYIHVQDLVEIVAGLRHGHDYLRNAIESFDPGGGWLFEYSDREFIPMHEMFENIIRRDDIRLPARLRRFQTHEITSDSEWTAAEFEFVPDSDDEQPDQQNVGADGHDIPQNADDNARPHHQLQNDQNEQRPRADQQLAQQLVNDQQPVENPQAQQLQNVNPQMQQHANEQAQNAQQQLQNANRLDLIATYDQLREAIQNFNINHPPNAGIPRHVPPENLRFEVDPIQADGPGPLEPLPNVQQEIAVFDGLGRHFFEQMHLLTQRNYLGAAEIRHVYLDFIEVDQDDMDVIVEHENTLHTIVQDFNLAPDTTFDDIVADPRLYVHIIETIIRVNCMLGYDKFGHPLPHDIESPFVYDGVFIFNSDQFSAMMTYSTQVLDNIATAVEQIFEQGEALPIDQQLNHHMTVLRDILNQMTTRNSQYVSMIQLLMRNPRVIHPAAAQEFALRHPDQDPEALANSFQQMLNTANDEFQQRLNRFNVLANTLVDDLRNRLFRDIENRQIEVQNQIDQILDNHDNQQIRRLATALADQIHSVANHQTSHSFIYRLWSISPVSRFFLAVHTTVGQLFRNYSTSDLYAFINNFLSHLAYSDSLATNVYIIDITNEMRQLINPSLTSCTLVRHTTLEQEYLNISTAQVMEPSTDMDIFSYVQLYDHALPANKRYRLDDRGRRRTDEHGNYLTEIDPTTLQVDLIIVPTDLRGVNPNGYIYFCNGPYAQLHSVRVTIMMTSFRRTIHFIIHNQDKQWPYSLWISKYYELRIDEPIIVLNMLLPTLMLVHCSISNRCINFTTAYESNTLRPTNGQPILRL